MNEENKAKELASLIVEPKKEDISGRFNIIVLYNGWPHNVLVDKNTTIEQIRYYVCSKLPHNYPEHMEIYHGPYKLNLESTVGLLDIHANDKLIMKHAKVLDLYKEEAIDDTYTIFKNKKKKKKNPIKPEDFDFLKSFHLNPDTKKWEGQLNKEITVKYKDKEFKLNIKGQTTIRSILVGILYQYKNQLPPGLKYYNYRIYKDTNFLPNYEDTLERVGIVPGDVLIMEEIPTDEVILPEVTIKPFTVNIRYYPNSISEVDEYEDHQITVTDKSTIGEVKQLFFEGRIKGEIDDQEEKIENYVVWHPLSCKEILYNEKVENIKSKKIDYICISHKEAYEEMYEKDKREEQAAEKLGEQMFFNETQEDEEAKAEHQRRVEAAEKEFHDIAAAAKTQWMRKKGNETIQTYTPQVPVVQTLEQLKQHYKQKNHLFGKDVANIKLTVILHKPHKAESTDVSINVSDRTTATEIIQKVCKKRDIRNPEAYILYNDNNKNEMIFANENEPLKITNNNEINMALKEDITEIFISVEYKGLLYNSCVLPITLLKYIKKYVCDQIKDTNYDNYILLKSDYKTKINEERNCYIQNIKDKDILYLRKKAEPLKLKIYFRPINKKAEPFLLDLTTETTIEEAKNKVCELEKVNKDKYILCYEPMEAHEEIIAEPTYKVTKLNELKGAIIYVRLAHVPIVIVNHLSELLSIPFDDNTTVEDIKKETIIQGKIRLKYEDFDLIRQGRITLIDKSTAKELGLQDREQLTLRIKESLKPKPKEKPKKETPKEEPNDVQQEQLKPLPEPKKEEPKDEPKKETAEVQTEQVKDEDNLINILVAYQQPKSNIISYLYINVHKQIKLKKIIKFFLNNRIIKTKKLEDNEINLKEERKKQLENYEIYLNDEKTNTWTIKLNPKSTVQENNIKEGDKLRIRDKGVEYEEHPEQHPKKLPEQKTKKRTTKKTQPKKNKDAKYYSSWLEIQKIINELLEVEDYILGVLKPHKTEEEFKTWMQEKGFHKNRFQNLWHDYNILYDELDQRYIFKAAPPPPVTIITSNPAEIDRLKEMLAVPIEIAVEIKKPSPNVKARKLAFMRPYFAPEPYSWEIDHLITRTEANYLICVNINTRFAYIMRVKNKSKEATKNAIIDLLVLEKIQFHHPIRYIRFDGDKGFEAVAREYNEEHILDNPIEFYAESSPYTNHNRIVDCVIKQLRRLAEPNHIDFNGEPVELNGKLYEEADALNQLMIVHNYAIHSGIGMAPADMHKYVDREWAYIRKMKEKLNDMIRKQMNNGMWDFQEGEWLRMYLDPDKTRDKFHKNKRQFKTWGRFVRYDHGNVVAKVKNETTGKDVEVTIPIYYAIPDEPQPDIHKTPSRIEKEIEQIREQAAQFNFRDYLRIKN